MNRLWLIGVALLATLALAGSATAAQKPTKLSLEVNLTHATLPYTIKVSGKLTLAKAKYATACTGQHVIVAVKHAKTRLFKKNVKLTASCTYKMTIKLSKPEYTHPTKLRVYSRHPRNATFLNISAHSVRIVVDPAS